MTSTISRGSATGWTIGIVVGLAAGFGTAAAAQGWQESREAADLDRRTERFAAVESVPEPVDAVRELLEQDSLVAIDPLLADRVSQADRQRAEELLAASPVPARIAYLADDDGVYSGYTSSGAAAMWQAAIGEEGHYVMLFDNGLEESGAIGLDDHYVSTRTQGQPGPALVRIAEEMATWEAEPLALKTDDLDQEDYWGGTAGGVAIGATAGTLVIVPLFALFRWYVGSRRRKDT